MSYNRRDVLQSAGSAVTLGMLAPAFGAKQAGPMGQPVHAMTIVYPGGDDIKLHGEMGEPASAMKLGDTCLTILYPNSEGVRWDVEYYRTHHMPLIMKLYGKDAIKRFELRKGATGQAPGSPPTYIGSVNIYINDQSAFDAAGKQHGPTLVKDVPHFSSVMPIAFPTRIHGIG